MGRLVKSGLPCPCGRSSDAYSTYDDGHGYCFRGDCKRPYFPSPDDHKGVPITVSDQQSFTYQYLPYRGISAETLAFFKVATKVGADGTPLSLGFPYSPQSSKVRSYSDKRFTSIGNMSDESLFGMDRFSGGSARAITITEGELDALSAYEMLGSKYPVVSVRSGSTARTDCARARDYLNSFEKIYLCFDNDETGQKATREVAALFDFNKVYHVKLTQYKDANDYLQAGKASDYRNIWYNSRRFLPEGIISSQSEFNSIIDSDGVKEGQPYPFAKLQELTYGLRTGEVVLLTALEGIGKTEIVRAIEYSLLRTTDANLGIIHLEESKARTLKGLAGYHLRTPVHLPDSQVSPEVVKSSIQELIKKDERLHIYSHFGSSDPDVILDTIRFLATACQCKYIFLDHISMVVSGLGDEDERKTLDYISTRLAMMVEELDFALIMVSHVNDEGKTRGSRNISKIADLWVHLHRDQLAPTEEERNTTSLVIRKNRFGAQTGPAGLLMFNRDTFMIEEKDPNKLPKELLPPVGISGISSEKF